MQITGRDSYCYCCSLAYKILFFSSSYTTPCNDQSREIPHKKKPIIIILYGRFACLVDNSVDGEMGESKILYLEREMNIVYSFLQNRRSLSPFVIYYLVLTCYNNFMCVSRILRDYYITSDRVMTWVICHAIVRVRNA